MAVVVTSSYSPAQNMATISSSSTTSVPTVSLLAPTPRIVHLALRIGCNFELARKRVHAVATQVSTSAPEVPNAQSSTVLGQENVALGKDSTASDERLKIANLGISKEIVTSLARRRITKLTPIQAEVFKPAMQGRDLFGQARTGTGKTLAYGIPIMERILQHNSKLGPGRYPLAIILTPTRDLARQVGLEIYYTSATLEILCCSGGIPLIDLSKKLKYGVDIVVGTPGRIIDLIRAGYLSLVDIQFVILDEADQLLNQPFLDYIHLIFQTLPEKRQCMLFSATLPKWIQNSALDYLNDPLTIDLAGEGDNKLPDGITLYSIASPLHEKASILGPLITEHAKGGKCLVFTQTKRDAAQLALGMSKKYSCGALHGAMSHIERRTSVSGFRSGLFNILIATDIAARGLDIPNVDLVIHYEIPRDSGSFVHRTGRTARAGKKGTSILIHTEHELSLVRAIERENGCSFTELPTIDVKSKGIDIIDMSGQGSSHMFRRGGYGKFGRGRDHVENRFDIFGGRA